ncbi:hypothetical protein CsatA_007002 [Cannabis sativa]
MATIEKFNKDIHPSETKWRVKVIVLEKGMPKTARNAGKRYKNLLLSNCRKTQIQATIYDDDIETFQNTLTVHGCYYISNAYVKFTKPQYQVLGIPYEWVINSRCTLVENVSEEDISMSTSVEYKFTPFVSFSDHMDQSTSVDLMSVEIYCES